MELPRFYQAKYELPAPRLVDLETTVTAELCRGRFWRELPQGARVALLVGSRGIKDIVPILKVVLRFLRDKGLQPVLLPAMGSHGGGTAAGQLKVLAGLGITEAALEARIDAGGDAIKIGEVPPGIPVYLNPRALDYDCVIPINRVKPHTSFHGPIESGLLKMLAVGLGNPKGAAAIHRRGPSGLRQLIPLVGSFILDHAPVGYGLAIVENSREETALVEGIEPDHFLEREQKLLERARELMPRLPFTDLDLLVVREMGKCFSGTGLDTNIIGRLRIEGEPEPETPNIKRIVVLDLAERSEGNATGIGLADFVTDRLLAKVDWQATYLNVLSATFVMRAMTPIHYPSDQETIATALASLGAIDPRQARVLVIDNTLELGRLALSAALLEEARRNPYLTVSDKSKCMLFVDGRLQDFD